MLLYDALSTGGFDMPGFYDPDDKRPIGIILKPYPYALANVYLLGDIFTATEFDGLFYEVINPGISVVEPAWNTAIKSKTTVPGSGLTVIARAYNLMPIADTVFSVLSTATNGVTLTTDVFNDYNTTCKINPIEDNATALVAGAFSITTHIVKTNGQEFDITRNFLIGQH